MLVCGCGRWMHTQGVEEREGADGDPAWLVRSECLGCGLRLGCEARPAEALLLVDRLIWTDEARHRLERMPPYVAPLVQREIEEYGRAKEQRVITLALMAQARNGEEVSWDSEAEQRLANVPASVRAMAKVELERTAIMQGLSRVTVSVMEEVKARYFGFAGRR